MVVSYSRELSSIGFTTGLRLLAKWRGSIFKVHSSFSCPSPSQGPSTGSQVIYREMFLFWVAYGCMSLVYRLALNDVGRRFPIQPGPLRSWGSLEECSIGRNFERVAMLCRKYGEWVPITFILGPTQSQYAETSAAPFC